MVKSTGRSGVLYILFPIMLILGGVYNGNQTYEFEKEAMRASGLVIGNEDRRLDGGKNDYFPTLLSKLRDDSTSGC